MGLTIFFKFADQDWTGLNFHRNRTGLVPKNFTVRSSLLCTCVCTVAYSCIKSGEKSVLQPWYGATCE